MIAIAGFAYCGLMYRDALRSLERKFGQPKAVVGAHLDKLSNIPPLKIHNSDNIINNSAVKSSLVGVFKSLSYDDDLKNASLFNQAVQKLPPNMKESWSLFTVKKHWVKPTLLDFNNWLKEKAEAHDLMKQSANKARPEDNSASVTKTKTASKVFVPQPRKRTQSISFKRESAEQRGAIVRITRYCTEQIGFSHQNSQQISIAFSLLAT